MVKTKQRFKINKSKNGFTLMEVLIYVGVLMILLTAIFSLLLWLVRSDIKAKVMREVLDNAKRSMNTMVYEIKEAKNIYNPTTSSSQLSLVTTKYLPGGETSTYIDFYLCGTQLCLKKESQDPTTLTSEAVEVKNLVFTKIISNEAPSIQINLTIEYKNPSGRPEYSASISLTSTASLRSY